ncbi:receptor-transporting protein 3-like [Hypanus sabinus]|uniref:receptor-transporting protein 3-like n=1 Tax=Hypanus sabinus TaxID=79690 RepID=UPI0028C486F4|nr:receptor-transporting protein 3-like [Hypanus sabinus]XP_059844823.1 receptor-transporting protein 3-like [Hypanus sabinus]
MVSGLEYKMARVPGTNAWIEHFNNFIEGELSEPWSLNFRYDIVDKLDDRQRANDWKIYKTSAFGRFNCRCSHSWCSARVNIVFHYRRKQQRGSVLLRPFRQQCRDCKNPLWLKPRVNSTEMDQVFGRLIVKILKNCYNVSDVDDRDRSLKPRRTSPHEKDLCEACILGICSL